MTKVFAEKRLLKILALSSSLLLFGTTTSYADPEIVPGVTTGTLLNTGFTLFVPGSDSGDGFVFEEITAINADKTLPFYVDDLTNQFWNVLPVETSEVLNLADETTIVWGGAGDRLNTTTTLAEWIADYTSNYGIPGQAIRGFNYVSTGAYRAWGLDSVDGKTFFTGPSSVDLVIDGLSYRALVIGVNTILVDLQQISLPQASVNIGFLYIDSEDRNSRIQISRSGEKIICKAGQYLYGKSGVETTAKMTGVTYSLNLDGAQIASAIADGSEYAFDASLLDGTKGLASCSLTLSLDGAELKDRSDWSQTTLLQAETAKTLAIENAEHTNFSVLQNALAELSGAEASIKENYREAREKGNQKYWLLNAELKAKLTEGLVTHKEFAAQLRIINADALKQMSAAAAKKVSDLAEIAEARKLAVRNAELDLAKAFGSINEAYAKSLETAGYGIMNK